MIGRNFVDVMKDAEYIETERREREDADRRHRERVARNTAPAWGNTKPTAQQLRDSITSGRTYSYDHEVARRNRSSGGRKGKVTKDLSAAAPAAGERDGSR